MSQIDITIGSPIVHLAARVLASLPGAHRHHATRSGWETDVTVLFVVIAVIVVALIFDFTNGFHDSANAMAGPIATGALKPRTAVILAAVLNLVGACLSTEVAKTISGVLFDDAVITAPIVLAGL